ncbi:MAG TPA: CHAD domain-containing protein [Polyangiaceae bacterium]|nr:CHAD domain-containing protein [Polyangiaceae bacterium]
MFRLDLNESVPREIRRLLLDELKDGEAALLGTEGSLAERVHEARKRIKRVRAVLALVDGGGPGAELAEACRRAAARLAGPRGHAALLHSYERLVSLEPECENAALRQELHARAASVSEGAPDFLEATARCLHDARAFAKQVEVQGNGFDAIARGFRATYRRARRALHLARASGKATDFHAFRKPCKRHFYQLRLLEDVWPAVMETRTAELDRTGELAGEHHDLSLLRDELKKLVPGEPGQGLDAIVARRERQLEQQILALGELCFAERGRAITSRVRRYWQATAENGIVAKPTPEV